MSKLIANRYLNRVLSHAASGLGTSKLLVPLFAAVRLNTNIYTLPRVAGEIERDLYETELWNTELWCLCATSSITKKLYLRQQQMVRAGDARAC